MAAPVLETIDPDLLDDNLVFNKEKDWEAAKCYNKIYTHPKTGLQYRVEFINEIVVLANSMITQKTDSPDNIKSKILSEYKKLLRLLCHDESHDLGELNMIVLGYINSLGDKPEYYPETIHRIKVGDEDITTEFFKYVMKLLRTDAEEGMARWRKRIEETLTPADMKKQFPHLYAPDQGPYPQWVTSLGGKIRSAKRRPHRKSSATKRHPRRKSSAIKHRRRRTSRK